MPDRLACCPVIIGEIGDGQPDTLERVRACQVENSDVGGKHGVEKEGRLQHHFGRRCECLGGASRFSGAGFARCREVDGGADVTRVPPAAMGSRACSGQGVSAGTGVPVVFATDFSAVEFVDSFDKILIKLAAQTTTPSAIASIRSRTSRY